MANAVGYCCTAYLFPHHFPVAWRSEANRLLSRTQNKGPFNLRRTLAKRFVLNKIHLEAMTSFRPLCLSICSSFPDLFCSWKLNSKF